MCSLFTVRMETERGKGYREKGRLRSPVLTTKQANKNKRPENQKFSWLWRTGTLSPNRTSLWTKFLKSCTAFNNAASLPGATPRKCVPMHMRSWGHKADWDLQPTSFLQTEKC